jgi:histidinol-phosphate phosphatase family protein
MRVLGVNAVFHDPAAALVADGEIVAAEEERFRRRKRGEASSPFSTRELPEGAAASRPARAGPPAAVLLDRDGTLVVDEPYNGDPGRVVPMPGAREALERLRAAGIQTAVVSNQSGVARGLVTPEQVEAVNRRIEELLGPVGPWLVCPHAPHEGCECRKPAPGLVFRAAKVLGVEPARCTVIGDVGADVEAAHAAGARAVLVPTPRTRPEEIQSAPEVALDLPAAVELVLGGSG